MVEGESERGEVKEDSRKRNGQRGRGRKAERDKANGKGLREQWKTKAHRIWIGMGGG